MLRVPGFQSRSGRIQTDHKAKLINPDGRQLDVIVTQLSAGGFRVAVGEMLIVGHKVRILVDRYGAFPAEIRWATGDQAGGIFLEPVPLNAI